MYQDQNYDYNQFLQRLNQMRSEGHMENPFDDFDENNNKNPKDLKKFEEFIMQNDQHDMDIISP